MKANCIQRLTQLLLLWTLLVTGAVQALQPTLFFEQSFTASGAGTSGMPTAHLQLPDMRNRASMATTDTERHHHPYSSEFAFDAEGKSTPSGVSPEIPCISKQVCAINTICTV